jgi:hypothetical protein
MPHGISGFDSLAPPDKVGLTNYVNEDPDQVANEEINRAILQNDNVKFPDHSSDDKFESVHP